MSGTIQNDPIQVARSLLVADLARFADHVKSAPLNEYQTHDAVAAAEFLGDAEVLKQARELIPGTPRFHLVPRPDYAPLSLEQLVAGIHRMAENSPMLKCCSRGDYAAAFQLADCPRAIEEIAVTQACLGELTAALDTADRSELEDFRRTAIHEIVVIEAFRRNQHPIAQMVLTRLQNSGSMTPFKLSVGLLGRRPWIPYPYFDW